MSTLLILRWFDDEEEGQGSIGDSLISHEDGLMIMLKISNYDDKDDDTSSASDLITTFIIKMVVYFMI
jgi:hypothetical protein